MCTYYMLGTAFGFSPNSDSAEFGLFEIDQFTFGVFYFLGLKFISSKRIFRQARNILQLTYILSFLLLISPQTILFNAYLY